MLQEPQPSRKIFVDGIEASIVEWWRTEAEKNKLLTPWINDIHPDFEMTPPPTEFKELAEWVGKTAFAAAKAIQANAKEYQLWEYPPELGARLLYWYAQALVTFRKFDERADTEQTFMELGRIETLEETLKEMGILDFKFVRKAFKEAGFPLELIDKYLFPQTPISEPGTPDE